MEAHEIVVCGNCRHFRKTYQLAEGQHGGTCELPAHWKDKIKLPPGLTLATAFYQEVRSTSPAPCNGSFFPLDDEHARQLEGFNVATAATELISRLAGGAEVNERECCYLLKQLAATPELAELAERLVESINASAAAGHPVDTSRDKSGGETARDLYHIKPVWVKRWSPQLGKLHGDWRCPHCGRARLIRYIATGHDHTDSSAELCDCPGAAATGERFDEK